MHVLEVGRRAEGERTVSRLHAQQRLTQVSIPQPWDHDLSRKQELDTRPTEPPRSSSYSSFYDLIITLNILIHMEFIFMYSYLFSKRDIF